MPHVPSPNPADTQISCAGWESLSRQRGKVVWFTGLSGSGKSTLAQALEQALRASGCRTCLLDGDVSRRGISRDLGFSREDRIENTRRVAEMARLMSDAGLIVLVALISPFRQGREQARALLGPDNFVEVYMSTPLQTCISRDPKGLYRKAAAGQLSEMTGVDSLYEAPHGPHFSFDTSEVATTSHVQQLMQVLVNADG